MKFRVIRQMSMIDIEICVWCPYCKGYSENKGICSLCGEILDRSKRH